MNAVIKTSRGKLGVVVSPELAAVINQEDRQAIEVLLKTDLREAPLYKAKDGSWRWGKGRRGRALIEAGCDLRGQWLPEVDSEHVTGFCYLASRWYFEKRVAYYKLS